MSDLLAALTDQAGLNAETANEPNAVSNADTVGYTDAFIRFLAAKKSVDDRALNRHVWEHLSRSLPLSSARFPLRILEVGAGIGTMIERMVDWDLVRYGIFTAVDSSAENVQVAARRLEAWALARGMRVVPSPGNLTLQDKSHLLKIAFETEDVHDFINRNENFECWDLLVAHAFLDLVDIPSALPGLFRMLAPGGHFLLTINFDGDTILEPAIDPALDQQILNLYHQTMDDRITKGLPSGDSRAGRHLFQHLKAAGAEILSAGASDWVVFGGPHGYPEDEAYFLHFIMDTIQRALTGHSELDNGRFANWITERHAQVERAELVYIAHQLDFFGRLSIEG